MATSADWNMWLGQGQNRQVDPLAPLNQQFGGSQGAYIPAGANTPTTSAYMADPYRMALAGAPAQGQGQTSIADDWNKWRTEPTTPTIPQQAAPLERWQQGQGESMGGGQDWSYAKAAQEPQLVNPKTGGAGGTPTATGWTDTSVPDLTLQSDNAANKPKGPGATGVFANDQWVNEAGNRFDYGDATQAGGKARAGTALAKGAIKTWVNYDGSRDTQLHDYNGIDQETSWRRVNRWTQAGVAEHGLTPQEAHNAALARLKRDFEISKLDWRTSGYDLSNVQAAPRGQDWAKANAVGAVPAVDPKTGKPKVEDPKIDPATGKPKVDPQTGLPQTDTTKTPFTPGKGFFSEADLKQVADDPATALKFWRSRNGGRDKSGAMGEYRDNMMAKALQAYVNTLGVGGNNPEGGVFGAANLGLEDMLSRFQSGQGVGGMLRDNASRMMNGIDFSNMDGDQIQNILNLAAGAATFGAPTMAQYGFDNAAKDLEQQADDQYFNGGGKTSVLADPRNRQKFTDLLSQWLQMQQGG